MNRGTASGVFSANSCVYGYMYIFASRIGALARGWRKNVKLSFILKTRCFSRKACMRTRSSFIFDGSYQNILSFVQKLSRLRTYTHTYMCMCVCVVLFY